VLLSEDKILSKKLWECKSETYCNIERDQSHKTRLGALW